MKNNKTHADIIESASITSLMRFLLSGKNEKVPNPDAYGKYFVNGKWKEFLHNVDKSKTEMQKKLPGCLYYHLIRTLKFDESLKKWLGSHKDSQILILGAGFDSRSMRFSQELNATGIILFEVDLKAMLDFKLNIIKKYNLQTNNQYYQVPCNFNDQKLINCFKEYKVSSQKPTLILWEGVTYFLPESVIKTVLEELRNYFDSELQITLDYAYRDYIDGNLNYYGAKELYDILIEINEPHFFGLNFDESEHFFKQLSFNTKENLSAMMLESKFLRDNFGQSVGLPHVFNAMADITSNKQENVC
ncbi:SAM-dependent methyltransferase [Pasteurellaceae bacterium LIM206]|nr:SAM-dependent methyltransferase [Pasteurellaceae bacterium LIM206]